MIGVVIEKHDFAAEFGLQPARGLDFRDEKAFRKKSARLLPKTNDGCAAHAVCNAGGGDLMSNWINALTQMHVMQPMTLYQR